MNAIGKIAYNSQVFVAVPDSAPLLISHSGNNTRILWFYRFNLFCKQPPQKWKSGNRQMRVEETSRCF